MIAISSAVRQFGMQCSSVEELAARVARYLHEHLLTDAGSRQTALVRFYKTHAYDGLDDAQQQFARRALAGLAPTPAMKCLALLGTAGEEPAWNDRRESVGHQVIPLPSEAFVAEAPMIRRLLQQLRVDVGALVRADTGLVDSVQAELYNVFHVATALGSPHIPAQDFVVEHGVASVLGFGGLLPSGDVFAVLLFSRSPVPAETAELFATVALSVMVSLLPLLDGPLLDAQLQAAGGQAAGAGRVPPRPRPAGRRPSFSGSCSTSTKRQRRPSRASSYRRCASSSRRPAGTPRWPARCRTA